MHGRQHCFFGALIIIIQAAFPLFAYAQDTIRIEAENYTAMNGVQTEPSTDIGGGLNVGWIETHDWLSYTLDVPETGHYTVRYRVASESAGGEFHLRDSDNDVILDEVDFNATGGWQSWVTIESSIELSAGSQTLAITALQSGWNINWIEFEPASDMPASGLPQYCISSPLDPYAPIKIEAEHYVRMAGVQTEETTDEGGGLNIGWIEPQDTLTYAVELAHSGLYKISYRVASRETEGQFQLESSEGGQVYDSVAFPPTGDWQNWKTVESSVVLPAGSQELTIRALSQEWNINWLQLELVSPDARGIRIRAENYTAMHGVQAEPTDDFGGGMNIGYIESGDWMSYTLSIPEAGFYDIHYRLASLQNGGHFRLLAQSLDEPVEELSFPATGGWQNWTTVSSRVQLEEGDQQLKIESLDHGWNINWFELVPVSPSQEDCETIRIQAQHYNDMQGVQSEITLDNSGGLNLGWIHSGDWVAYPLTLPDAGRYRVSYRVASPYPASFQVENVQGEVLDTLQFAATGGWQDWVTLESELTLEEESLITIKSLSDEWNINWFDLTYLENTSSSSSSSNISSSSSSYSSSSESSEISESSASSSSWIGSSSSYSSSVSSESSSSSSDEVSSSSNSSVSSSSSSDSSGSVSSESSSWISSSISSSSSVSSDSTSSSSDGVSSSSSADSSISVSSESSESSASSSDPASSSSSSSVSSLSSSSESSYSVSSESSDTSSSWSSSSDSSLSSDSSQSSSSSSEVVSSSSSSSIGESSSSQSSNSSESSDSSSSWGGSSSSSSSSSSAQEQAYRIEAENFDAMEGVEVETSWDGGVADIVSWTNAGDYLAYTVNAPSTGTYKITYRYVSEPGGGRLSVLGNNQLLDVVEFPSTGDWSSWSTVESTVELSAGSNVLDFYIDNGGWNFNWFEIEKVSDSSSSHSSSESSSSSSSSISPVAFRLEAENFDLSNGVETSITTDESGGMDVVNIDFDDYIGYVFNIPVSGIYRVSYRVSSVCSGRHFVIGGQNHFNKIVEFSGSGLDQWITVDTTMELLEGEINFRLNSIMNGWIINYIDFELIESIQQPVYEIEEVSPLVKVEAENYIYSSGSEIISMTGASAGEALLMNDYQGWTGFRFTLPAEDEYRVVYRLSGGLPDGTSDSNNVYMNLDTDNGTIIYDEISESYDIGVWTEVEALVDLEGGSNSYNITNHRSDWLLDSISVESLRESEYSGPYAIGQVVPAEEYAESEAVYTEKSNSAETGWSVRHAYKFLSDEGRGRSLIKYPITVDNAGTYKIVFRALTIDDQIRIQGFVGGDINDSVLSISLENKSWNKEWKYIESVIDLPAGEIDLWLSTYGGTRIDTFQIVPVAPDPSEEFYEIQFISGNSQVEIGESIVRAGHAASFTVDVDDGYHLNGVSGCGVFRESSFYTNSPWWTAPMTEDCVIEVYTSPIVGSPQNIQVVPGDGMVTVYWDEVDNAESYDIYVSEYPLEDIHEFGISEGVIKVENASSPAAVNNLVNNHEYHAYVVPKKGPWSPWLGVEHAGINFFPSVGGGIIQNRFELLAGGIVKDLVTGLEWKRCSHGNIWNGATCVGDKENVYWDSPLFEDDPLVGWRGASKNELNTLVYCSSGEPWYWKPIYMPFAPQTTCQGEYLRPTINSEVFPDVDTEYYMVSSGNSYYKDFVYFYDGGDYSSARSNDPILLVRDNDIELHRLTVYRQGEGSIKTEKSAIDCGGTCNYIFSENLPIILLAEAATGYSFSHWEGICEGQGSRCELEGISQQETVTAHFEEGETGRFRSVTPGIVWDAETGLEWERCAYGRVWEDNDCTGEETPITWSQHEILNDSRWRLPEGHEFGTIIHCSSGAPVEWNPPDSGCVADPNTPDFYLELGWAITIDRQVFPGAMAGPYWTATSDSESTAVSVSLVDGSKTDQAQNLQGMAFRVRDRELHQPVIEPGQTAQLRLADSPLSEGEVTSHQWISRSTGEVLSTEEVLSLDNLPVGRHVFELRVVDGAGNEYSDYYVVSVGYPPEIVVENPMTGYMGQTLRIDASQSHAGNEALFFHWEKDGELLSELAYVDILIEEAESFDVALTVSSETGLSRSEVVRVDVEEINAHLEACPYTPVDDDYNRYLPYPDNDIQWIGGFAETVGDIQRGFNYARKLDPSVHQYLLMPSQADWDAMSLQEKGLYLVNAERMARGIKPYSGYDTSIIDVAQEYSDYILDNNLVIDHYHRDESPMDRLMSDSYTAEYADSYIKKPESIAVSTNTASEVDAEYALIRAIYNWVYRDKEWYLDLGYENGEPWGHRDHILQTGLGDNHADSTSEGVAGFGVTTGVYDPSSEPPSNYGGVTVFNTIDQGENWDNGRIGTVDISQAQGCVPYAINLPEDSPDVIGLESLRIEPAGIHLAVGQQKSVSITGVYSDGSEANLGHHGNLAATDSAIVDVSQGVIDALSPGSAKVYVRIGDIESNRLYITVGQPLSISGFEGTDAESVAPYLADNATVPQPLNAADERVADYDPKAMSVFTGLVTDRYGVPVSGVNVSFLKARNYGSVETDNEGRFMLAGPSGKQTLVYEKPNHLVVQRTTTASSGQWATLETVILLPRDTKVTHIDLASGEPQVHQSSTIVDEFGARKATVVFNNVSAAEIHSWDGSVKSIDSFDLSVTEFEIPESMPGELPEETAFTWASDFHVEGTHYSDKVIFDEPVYVFVDNFLGFSIGEIVPIGFFNRRTSLWEASENGVVVQVVDENNDGTADGLDYTGDSIADDLNGNGSTSDEVTGLQGYSVGDVLLWGRVNRFSTWDYNNAPEDAEAPENVETEEEEEDTCEENQGQTTAKTGSKIDAYQQTFHEEIPIAGTNVTLNYSSRRTSGYQHRIRVRVSGEEISPSLENMIARLEIAGHVFEQEFFPEPNVVAEFIWDGDHPDGTRAKGLVSGRVSIGYEYQTMYLSAGNAAEEDRPLSSFPVAWATLSDVVTQVPGRERFIAWQQKGITLKNTYGTQLAEGWSLSAVHELDPKGKVYLGGGKAFDVATPSLILKTGLTYSFVNGDDGYYQTGGRDIDYTITDRNTLVDNVTGLEWQYTQQPFRTRSRAEAAAYCENEAEPRDMDWRLPTAKEAGYTVDKSGGSAGQMIYSLSLASGLWKRYTANVDNNLLGTVCVSGPILGHDIDDQLERNDTDEVVVDKDNGLMWQDTLDNELLTLGWEESINYCEDSLHAGYDDWRLPNINELLYILPNESFVHQTTLPPDFGVWNHNNPHRNPYWSSTSNIQDDELAWVSESNGYNNRHFAKQDAYHVRCVRQDSTASRMPLRFNGENQHVASFDMLSGSEYQFIDYNADGEVIGIEDQFDNRLVIERNVLGQPVRLVAPDGQITELSINDANHLTQVLYEDASRYDFTYSEGGLLTEKIDPRGERYTREYNDIGRVEQATDPASGLWQTFNNKLGLNESLFGYTTAEGNTQQVEQRVLPNGDTLQTTTTLSGAERVRLTSEDKLTESITAYGMSQVIHKELDQKTLQPVPRHITVTAPSGLTRTTGITKTFAQNGADTSAYTLTVDDNGDISTTVVDGGEGTWVHTSAEGRTATIHTDPETLLTERIQVPGLHDSHSVYDDRGRLVEAHTGDRVTSYSYNASGYLASITASDNRVTEFEYDLLGRTTHIHYPDGFSTAFEYDANGNATKVTVPTQEVHDFTFTAINQVETENQPPATTTAYTYNREKALTEIQLPSGESIHYDYQNARLQQMQTPEGITEYRYQQGDQLHEVETGAELARYHYDGTLLTGLEYEGELTTRIDYGYDNHFRTNQVTYAGDSTSIGYDQDGLITTIHGYTLDYSPQNGLPESMANGTWRKQWSWTPYGEVSAVSHQLGAQESYGYALEYNQTGQISRKTERRHDGSLVTYDYTYDNRYRLTEVRENGQLTEAYSYDANGNRVSQTSVHRGINNQSATYATGDQLQSQGNTSYSYDANGRLASKLTTVEGEQQLTTYVYSSLGQLLQVDTPEQSIAYRHNALGQRVAKLVNGQVTEKYLWRDLTTLLATYDANGNVKQRFEHSLGHTPTSFTQDGERYFIQSDYLGSPRVITDGSGNVVKTIDYDSYGNVIEDTNSGFEIPFGFAGGLYDKDTGLIRFGFRDYDAEAGRWTARDPIGYIDGPNLYVYTQYNPISYRDVTGTSTKAAAAYCWTLVSVWTGADTVKGVYDLDKKLEPFRKHLDRIDERLACDKYTESEKLELLRLRKKVEEYMIEIKREHLSGEYWGYAKHVGGAILCAALTWAPSP